MVIVVVQIIPLTGADDSQYRFQHIFMNPSPAIPPNYDAFGFGLATLGDYILVGSDCDGLSTIYPEEVYLFNGRTGVLLKTFYNPAPNEYRRFGSSVAADGDRVFVGSPNDSTQAESAGAVHVFDANTGTLLRTIYSPTPNEGDYFGYSIAAKGNMVLVGSQYDDSAGVDAGAVYLFDAQTGSHVTVMILSYGS